MNRLFRLTNILVLCCVSLFLFGVHTNVGQCGLKGVGVTASWEPGTDTWLKLPRYATSSGEPFTLKPAQTSQVYHPSAFNVFLPPRTDNVVGDAWSFDARRMLPFLRQFHPGATVSLSGQQGAYACLRAVSPAYYEIVFQFHADFNLEMPKEIEGLMVENEKFTDLKKSVDEAFAELKQEQDILQQSVAEEVVGLQEKLQGEAVAAAERQQIEEEIAGFQKKLKAELDTADDLANLKKELAETVASLTKITTALEGLSGDLETRLNELKTTITALEDIVSNLDSRLDELEQTLTAHFDEKLDELEQTLTAHFDARIHELKTELTAKIASSLDALETELSAKLEEEFNRLINVINARENILTERFNALLTAEVERLRGTQAYDEGIYLKPKQFTGRLLISKDEKNIIGFTLKCPPHEGNATLFVFGDTEKVSMPRMELIYPDNIEAKKIDITWTDTITAEQADEILRSKFAARMSQTEHPIETR